MRKALFIMASALLIAGCGGQKSETPQKKEMSLQLYSIRAEFKKAKEAGEDYSDILKKVAEAGFTSVEAASYNDGKLYGDEPQVYRKKVEDAGLVSLSSHVSCRLSPEELETGDLSKTMEFWDKCIAAHKAAGVKYLVDPSIGRQASLKNLQVYCDMLNEVGRRCKEQGILFGYHNHSYEFEKVEDTVM
jgi:sugar phosphate isomerase/epimerase